MCCIERMYVCIERKKYHSNVVTRELLHSQVGLETYNCPTLEIHCSAFMVHANGLLTVKL